jgi:hypothetical protein
MKFQTKRSTETNNRNPAARQKALVLVAAVGFYAVTIGAIPAIGRHMTDGRLQWMRESSLASTAMQLYRWPATYLTVLPGAHRLFDLSADIWCAAIHAPETT